MKGFGLVILLAVVLINSAAVAEETYEAMPSYPLSPCCIEWADVAIDADLADWCYYNRMIFSGDTWQANGGTWLDEADLTLTVMAKWDHDNLYVASIVRDEAHINTNNEQNIWAGDGIQIMIDPTGMRKNTEDVVYEFGYALAGTNSDEPMTWRWLKNISGPESFESEFAILRNDAAGTTVYEIRLPKEQIAPAKLDYDSVLGFAIVANDGDPGAEEQGGWVGWGTEAIAYEKEADELQELWLMPEPTLVQATGKLMSTWGNLKRQRK